VSLGRFSREIQVRDEEERDLGGLIPEILMADVKEQEQTRQERKEERKRATPPPNATPPMKAIRQTP